MNICIECGDDSPKHIDYDYNGGYAIPKYKCVRCGYVWVNDDEAERVPEHGWYDDPPHASDWPPGEY